MKKKNPLTKVLFMDHDGVMVLRDKDGDLDDFFSPKCVKVLNEIILATGCEIVISSDWRLNYDLRGLQEIYRNDYVIKVPFSITPDLYTKDMNLKDLEKLRTLEILAWLKMYKVDRWCAVDDMELYLPYFVQTEDIDGISKPGIKQKIINILNR
jgi:hypothetical protein